MKLILLKCPVCATPLTPENDDAVIACSNCHNTIAIAANGPVKMNVQFAAPDGWQASATAWMPFWVFLGRVNIQRRVTQGHSGSAEKESKALWAGPRRLYIPAWDLALKSAQSMGSRLIQKQPNFEVITKPEEVQLTAAVITPSEARKVLDFIVLAIEARRTDMLKDLAYELDVGHPKMWALPQGAY